MTGDAHAAIDASAVTRWMQQRTDLAPPLSFSPIPGGRSNLTFQITDASGRRWVLRRPPLHSVLASAHDVGREHLIMKALQPTQVPVPIMIGSELDASITGAPFFVMSFIDGLAPRRVSDVTSLLDSRARHRVGLELASTLASIHAVPIDEVGLGDLAKRSDYVARQLRRWFGQHRKSPEPVSDIAAIHERLASQIPAQRDATIVHGDFRLDNTIVGPDGDIRAVLDWELCTLGDPLADVGLLAAYWDLPSHWDIPGIPSAASIPDIPSLSEVRNHYARRSGRDLSDLGYYIAFGYWKLAVIFHGVAARLEAGAYGHQNDDHEIFRAAVPKLMRTATELLEP